MQKEEKEELPISFYVVAGFACLFLIFLIIQPPAKTGYISLDSLTSSLGPELRSKLPILIIGITAIIAFGVFFISYRHFKKKKSKQLSAPLGPAPAQENPGLIVFSSSKSDLSDEEMNKLFSDAPDSSPKMISEPKELFQPAEQKTLTSLEDLKIIIIQMLKKGMTKKDIANELQSKGYTLQQITKATEEINLDRVISYIKNALSSGFKKEQITKSLLDTGWSKEQVDKAFQLLGI